jgi:hypothetical protein
LSASRKFCSQNERTTLPRSSRGERGIHRWSRNCRERVLNILDNEVVPINCRSSGCCSAGDWVGVLTGALQRIAAGAMLGIAGLYLMAPRTNFNPPAWFPLVIPLLVQCRSDSVARSLELCRIGSGTKEHPQSLRSICRTTWSINWPRHGQYQGYDTGGLRNLPVHDAGDYTALSKNDAQGTAISSAGISKRSSAVRHDGLIVDLRRSILASGRAGDLRSGRKPVWRRWRCPNPWLFNQSVAPYSLPRIGLHAEN